MNALSWEARVRPALPLLLAAVTVLCYRNSFDGAFVLDDVRVIQQDPAARQFGLALRARRPLLTASFAANYACDGLRPAGYHLVNLLIHTAAALTLFGVVRRTLTLPRAGARSESASAWLAFAAASLWAAHPLQTATVTYVVQRAESLAGLCYVGCLYALVRGATSGRPGLWLTGGVLAGGLGLGAKESVLTLPVVAFAYDRIFLAEPARGRARARRCFLAGLAATWIPAALAVGRLAADKGAGVVSTHVSPWRYALTQADVIAHYLALSFRPWPLRLDYGWPVVGSVADVGAGGWAVVALGVAGAGLLMLRPAAGFLALWFFGVLAPTSSFLPRPDAAFAHRMYLPLAAVCVAVTLCADAVLRGIGTLRPGWLAHARTAAAVLLATIVTGFAALTVARNAEFSDAERLWLREAELSPGYARPLNELAMVRIGRGEYAAAMESARAALAAWEKTDRSDRRPCVLARTYQGVALQGLGRTEEAAAHYRLALESDPGFTVARVDLARLLLDLGRLSEAEAEAKEAARRDPAGGEAYGVMGDAAAERRDYERATGCYRENIRLQPGRPEPLSALAWLLGTSEDERVADAREAVRLAEQAASLRDGRTADVLDTLAAAYARAGRFPDAVAAAEESLRLWSRKGSPGAADGVRRRLGLYREGKCFVRPPAAPHP